MSASKWVRSRGVTRSSGSRGFFSPDAAAFCAALCLACAALSAFACCSGVNRALGCRSGLASLSFLSLSAIDLVSGTLGDAHPAPIGHDLEPDAGGLAVLGIGQRQVGQVD